MKINDSKILEKLKKGDSKAFKELFDLYYLPLSTYSLKYCDSFSLAEDIVQDLFIKIWNDRLYMKFDKNIGSYLFKAVKNNTLQQIKKKYNFVGIEDYVNNLMVEEAVDNEYLEEKRNRLHMQIEALPKKSKEVFKAIVLDNLKYKEAALEFGITVNTVKTHYTRALKQLRNAVEIIIIFFFI
ncbi:RNA polymerase sigma factor [Thalassobellus suaedae]|uniref:RNA polymerase sigma-70 factor n=1 Tax=Thalassobellus suaedae TaxID=3074124 RepID=A0ABY9Y0L4_9FLAO|nr:RNA polymerase sigma-70 factor [Flavobacteriaceae bacterium HL-DH14]WNH11495.1 RNA polymerase sigma-70 factor [Flavobacteriaceae bacterium HL-DH10]